MERQRLQYQNEHHDQGLRIGENANTGADRDVTGNADADADADISTVSVSLEAIELALIDVCETWTADSNALYDAEPPVHLHIKLTDGPSTWRGRPQVVDWLLRHGGIEVLIALACDAHVFRVSRWMEIVWKHYYPTDPMSALDHLDTPPMTGARTVLKRRIMRVWPAVRAVVANHANKDTIDD